MKKFPIFFTQFLFLSFVSIVFPNTTYFSAIWGDLYTKEAESLAQDSIAIFIEKLEECNCQLSKKNLDIITEMAQEIIINTYEHKNNPLYTALLSKISFYIEENAGTLPQIELFNDIGEFSKICLLHISFAFSFFYIFLKNPDLVVNPDLLWDSKIYDPLKGKYSELLNRNRSFHLDRELASIEELSYTASITTYLQFAAHIFCTINDHSSYSWHYEVCKAFVLFKELVSDLNLIQCSQHVFNGKPCEAVFDARRKEKAAQQRRDLLDRIAYHGSRIGTGLVISALVLPHIYKLCDLYNSN